MRRYWRRLLYAFVVIVLSGVLVYTLAVGWIGADRLFGSLGNADCRTPRVQYGWSYEAINYDRADDALLAERNDDLGNCTYQGSPAGDQVVTADGARIAGWYIPAARDIGPTGPTVVLVHGFGDGKAGILQYGAGLHRDFNLVAFDLRWSGRSSGGTPTAGVLEQQDLRAILDWLERTKHPAKIGVLGNSLGAVVALAEARDDARVTAFVLDSMHTRTAHQIEARVAHEPLPSYWGTTWAIISAVYLRTGVDIGSIDAEDSWRGLAGRPVLLTHGTADNEDLPERTQSFYEELRAGGVPAQLEWCPNSGHNAAAGMPVRVCADDFARWTSDFFTRTLGAS
jgi:pimeloyl-ACP methyl ester carboxylesterase